MNDTKSTVSAAVLDELLAEVANSEPSAPGNWFVPGKVVVSLRRVQVKRSAKESRVINMIIEFEVTEVLSETEMSVGDVRTTVVDISDEKKHSNVMAIVFALAGYDPSDGAKFSRAERKEALASMVNGDLNGLKVACHAWEVILSSGNPFIRLRWFPVDQETGKPSEALSKSATPQSSRVTVQEGDEDLPF